LSFEPQKNDLDCANKKERKMNKLTPFHKYHLKANAKMVPFAGYEMPIQYEGIVKEHLAVRSSAGLFDVSHMGEIWVEGVEFLEFTQFLTMNNVRALNIGQVQYSAMCYEDGGIVDDLLVYRFESKILLVVNASNLDKDWAHMLDLAKSYDVKLTNISDDTALLALQGPDTKDIMQELVSDNLESLSFYHFIETSIDGIPVILSRTGYTGEHGYEIYHSKNDSDVIWSRIYADKNEDKITLVGLGARDTLRIEMKYCLYGNDIDATTSPLEAKIQWACDLYGEEFLGQKALQGQKENKVKRFLVAFKMLERGLPRQGYEVFCDNVQMGVVTSGGQSPSLGLGIGIAYINAPFHKIGATIYLIIRGKKLRAEIIKPPFVPSNTN
jgi:aminomethyltransferase